MHRCFFTDTVFTLLTKLVNLSVSANASKKMEVIYTSLSQAFHACYAQAKTSEQRAKDSKKIRGMVGIRLQVESGKMDDQLIFCEAQPHRNCGKCQN